MNRWLNPDIKVYQPDVTLDQDSDLKFLRPGMSAKVEVVEEGGCQGEDAQAEAVALVVGAVNVATLLQGGDEPVEQPGGDPLEGVCPGRGCPGRVDDVVALRPLAQQLRDQLGRILQIRRKGAEAVPGDIAVAGLFCPDRTEVAAVLDDLDTRTLGFNFK